MQQADFFSIFSWWFSLFVVGLAFLPFTIRLFKNFFDRGYIFSKILGLVILSYASFLLGIFHVVPFSNWTIILLLCCVAVGGVLILKKQQKTEEILNKSFLITCIGEELLMISALLFLAYIRSFSPDIHGLEKYMDYGFINAIIRSTYFPPTDMWFTPLSINYYYFGHLVSAVTIKLSHVPPSTGYNLMLATIFAFSFTACFSLGMNLYYLLGGVRKKVTLIIPGILSALIVTLAGNLHILYAFFTPYQNENPVPLWKLVFSPTTFPNSYWYPNATRFIYNTIHEFPMYSWVVADIHGHVLDIPFVLLTLGVLLSFFFTDHKLSSHKKGLFHYLANYRWQILIGFLLAIMYMTNAWDGIIYFLLGSFVFLCSAALKENTEKFFTLLFTAIKNIVMPIIVMSVSFFLFNLPFSIHFKPFVSGVGVLCMPKFLTDVGHFGPLLFEAEHCQKSPFWQLIMLYGFFYFFVIVFFIFVYVKTKLEKSDIFVLLLIVLATLLIIIPEFIYVKDIYPAHYRANTMFKLVFQAFMLLALSSVYICIRILSASRRYLLPRSIFGLVSLILMCLVLYYPFLAIPSYYGNLKDSRGLDGTKYLQTQYPSDYAGITWLNEEVKGQPVILEAQSDSYTDYGRVSANTGLPTVLGWTVHEWLWRGTYDIPAPRITEVKTMYESTDIATTKSLLKKYKVSYVFIGSLENEKYPQLYESKFKTLGKIVFQKENTKIYKLYL